MAEEEKAPAGGGGLGKTVGFGSVKAPVWVWAVVGGVLLGGGYVYYRRVRAAKTKAAGTTDVGPTRTGTAFNNPTTILPMFQGSTVTQVDLDAVKQQIAGLQPRTPNKAYVTQGIQQDNGIADNNALGIAALAYGLTGDNIQDAMIGSSQIIQANPQVDWAQPVPSGTSLNIPLRWIADVFKSRNTPYNQGDSGQMAPPPNNNQGLPGSLPGGGPAGTPGEVSPFSQAG